MSGGVVPTRWMALLSAYAGKRGGSALWTRLAGLALAGGFLVLVLAFWHPVFRFTGLLQVDAANESRLLPALRGQPIALSPAGGYDGQYYAQLACDPSLRMPELRTAIDTLAYRARRILVPAVAWGLGGGQPGVVVHVYSIINIVCWFGLGVLLWRLLEADHWRGLAAWAGVMFASGTLVSVRYALTDLPALLLFVAAMMAVERARPRSALAWFAACLLARETMLVGAWGMVPKAWEAAPAKLWRTGMALGLALVPLAVWLLYIRWQVGSSDAGAGNFAWPGAGLIGDWREEWASVCSGADHWLTYSSFLATVGLTAQAVFMVVYFRPGDRWWRAGAGYVLLMLILGVAVWEGIAGAALRVLLPLLLACNVMVIRGRLSSWWLLAINLSLVAGLEEMIGVTQLDHREIAATRHGDAAVVLRAGEGCFGLEQAGRNRWTWTEQQAELELQMWPGKQSEEAELSLSLRALEPRQVAILVGDRELWRGRVGVESDRVVLGAVPLAFGRLKLRIVADAPGVHESTGANPRALSVCVANPLLRVRPQPVAPPVPR